MEFISFLNFIFLFVSKLFFIYIYGGQMYITEIRLLHIYTLWKTNNTLSKA